jgi:PPOX class probable F420-dependent enzyme
MSFQIDEAGEFGARAARHLREDTIVWLTTVTPKGAPVPSPVWFLWREPDTVLMFSQPDSPRIRNLEANPRVALHFDGNGGGGDIVVLSGTASMDPGAAPASDVPAYTEKYGDDIARIGMDPESFSARYSVPVRIDLTRLRGH